MHYAGGSTMSAVMNPATETGCFHCGLPVPAGSHWRVAIDGVERAMCCPGCEAVAQAIVDNHLGDYYRNRQQLPQGVADAVHDALKLYDTPELAARFTGADGDGEATLSVEGIRCAACVWLIEKRLSQVPGLKAANLNVATEKLQVAWDASRCKPSDILQAVREVGYAAYPFDPIQHGELLRKNERKLFKRLFVAGLSMMQVMMYAVPVYLAGDDPIEPDMEQLMRWASLLLTVPAMFYSAEPFFRGAWIDLRQRALGMDVPVAIGLAAAFFGSTWATVINRGDVYFDTVTMFVFLLLCSRYLELVARRRAAGSLEIMQHALPDSAWLMKAYPVSSEPTMVAAVQLRAGDVILVKPGEAIPADALVLDGETSVDLSLLTGESAPQPLRSGEPVAGGAVNVSAPVVLRVEKVAKDSTLSSLIRLIERAGQGKPQVAQWADRVAAWFVAALLLFALAVFAFWSWHDPARAWPIAIAVLVVSCPCALSLATPSALAAATDRLLKLGVLVMQPHVLETLHRATHVVFDKTGTLTEGRPVLKHVALLGDLDDSQVTALAASLEAGSAHPIAQAFSDSKPGVMPVDGVAFMQGRGIEGRIGGVLYRIGNPDFVAGLAGGAAEGSAAEGVTEVFLGAEGRWLARFELADAVKPDARRVVDWFKAHGKQVILLSGDAPAIVGQVAAGLCIDEAKGGMLPHQKMEFVQALQRDGAVVAMVGDGINDAAVLRAADVSFAMGSGAALAQSHADAVLLTGAIASLLDAAHAATRCMRVIRQNLWWASLYNVVAIPAAAFGMITPWMAGVGMSASSALVVLNALRLQRPPRS